MSSCLRLRAGTPRALAGYIATQLHHLLPCEGLDSDTARVFRVLPEALERIRPILAAVTAFRPDEFDHFHSLQYATLLYLLGNTQSRLAEVDPLADRLFNLNRIINSIDLFHGIVMPEVFFISHGLGTVLGNATYGNRLVVFQNVTVGRIGADRPMIGKNVVLYPGSVVTGRTSIGDNSVIAAGTVVHGTEVPPDTLAVTQGGDLTLRPRRKDYAALYFRSSP